MCLSCIAQNLNSLAKYGIMCLSPAIGGVIVDDADAQTQPGKNFILLACVIYACEYRTL